jgi:SAM-dependent methyltransferase
MTPHSSPYTGGSLWSRLERALVASGKDASALNSADFSPVEHFHTGGLNATDELLGLLTVPPPQRILDIGGGIGGPARTLAQRINARVVIAEVSPDFCTVGRRLNQLAGMDERVTVLQADGTRLPFTSASFDLVWMQQANMNVEDKQALFSEIERVLLPGGHYCFQEVLAGSRPGPLSLPAPWAGRQADSHLETAGVTRERLGSLGLKELLFEDLTESMAGFTRRRLDAMAASGPPLVGVHLLSSADVRQTTLSTMQNIEDGRIAFVRGMYLKSEAGRGNDDQHRAV